jgi:starch phosphorylase
LTPRFSTNRSVREYTERHYLPAAFAYRERAAENGAVGRAMVNWEQTLELKWATLSFGDMTVETRGEQHLFEVQVRLHDLDPTAVRVELYANGVNGTAPDRVEMKRMRQLVGGSSVYLYSATVSAARSAGDYTARVIPHYDGVAVPLEIDLILWQR